MLIALACNIDPFRLYTKIRTIVKGVDQVEYQDVVDSVKNHSVEYEHRNIEFDAKVDRRMSDDSIMLETHEDNVWWYIDTYEKGGHAAKFSYKTGETHQFKLYIRSIDYESYADSGKGRYLVFSELLDSLKYDDEDVPIFVPLMEEVEYQDVVDSVKNHSVEYEHRNLEFDAVVKERINDDTVMLTTTEDNISWYVNTHEKSGHAAKFGYKAGETHRLILYIKDIDYKAYDNDGEGRYIVWSEIVE